MNSSQAEESSAAQVSSGKTRLTFDQILLIAVIVGIFVRFFYPFVDNPFNHLMSDSDRHFRSATEALDFNFFSVSDSLGYQLWLGAFARIFGKSRPVVAFYAGTLSAICAYSYFLWFRLSLPTRTTALLASLMMTWMPDWIKVYSYFLDETLLLPAVGFMLYFGWRAKSTLQLKDCLLFAAFAGFCFITKATCAPLIAMTYFFIAQAFWRSSGKLETANWRAFFTGNIFRTFAPSIAISVAVVLLAPISFFARTGAWCWVLPAQARSNALYFQSGAKTMHVSYRYFDRLSGQWRDEEYWFGCPSYYNLQLTPFSEWTSPRTGDFVCKIDYGKDGSQRFTPDRIDFDLKQRALLTMENWIYLFVGLVWPTEYPNSTVIFERWLWPVYVLVIAVVSIKRRSLNQLDMLCYAMMLVLMFQQECGVEGRYRMVWEGVVVPAFVLAVANWWRMGSMAASQRTAP